MGFSPQSADCMIDDDAELNETSEATMIVDSNVLKRVRDSATRTQKAYLIVIGGPHVGKMFQLATNETVLGRSAKADLPIQDVGISRRHAKLVRMGEHVFVEDMGSANGTYVNGEPVMGPHQLGDGDKISLGSTTILKFTYHDKLDEDFQKQMFEAALRDGLTKAYNKKYMLNHLETELAFAMRHRTPLAMIMFDLDHFKNVNDNYGHLAGDHVLVRISQIAHSTLRNEDTFARYGGEEFAVICRGIVTQQAAALGERLRQIVQATSFTYESRVLPVTISVGVAAFPEIDVQGPDQLIAAADAALYQSKRNGRNRVTFAR